jgi:deoxyribodipyrimidine photo-lyase
MIPVQNIAIYWMRRDLRLEDNAALYHALKSGLPVLPLFIFDRHILDALENRKDARVMFLHRELQRLQKELQAAGGNLLVKYGYPETVWNEVLDEFKVEAVYTNRDYEPYAKDRDKQVQTILHKNGAAFHSYKDHVIFESDEVRKQDGGPYVVFTPYSRQWKARLDTRKETDGSSFYLKPYPSDQLLGTLASVTTPPIPSLESMEFEAFPFEYPDRGVTQGLIKQYDQTRNFPATRGTSRLGIHFRFGTISIREKARKAKALNETFLNELIWRDFYSQILDTFPHVVNQPFNPKYNLVPWRNSEADFQAWCEGRTGYPIVDAGMRELNETGFMHNRVRMITASFFTKHLLLDWRLGEAWFAAKLLDFDLASNSGGWQWAAGCGTDAAPYFRIFNPTAQMEKFDKSLEYVRLWVPEYGTSRYPEPIVEHKFARERCLAAYKEGFELLT